MSCDSESMVAGEVKSSKENKSGSNKTSTSSVTKNSSSSSNASLSVPTEYKSALNKAQSCSDRMHMSKAGLYDQLTSEYGEKFSTDAAQYAVDNVKANWKESALAKAESYQDQMNMSPAAIYDQLVSEYGEQFTEEEAQYAIDHL